VEPIEQLTYILGGLPTTLAISILSFLLGFVIGLPLAFIRTYTSKPLQILVDGYEKVLRGVPEIVTMMFLYYGVGGISVFRQPFKNPFFSATFALGLRSGANQSQVFRGAIRGIGEQQMVASRSLGLSRLQAIIYVMAPQTFIIASPGLGSEYALLVKDSAYAFILGGVADIMRRATTLSRIPPYDLVFPYITSAFLYILLTFPLATYLDMWGSRKKKQLGL